MPAHISHAIDRAAHLIASIRLLISAANIEAPSADTQCMELFQFLVGHAIFNDAGRAKVVAPVWPQRFERINQQPVVTAIRHRMDDDAAYKTERLENTLHVLEGGVRSE